jgi:hypothetical protein
MRAIEIMQTNANLLQVVHTRSAACGFTSLLHRWQQKPNQDSNNRNDDKQFD